MTRARRRPTRATADPGVVLPEPVEAEDVVIPLPLADGESVMAERIYDDGSTVVVTTNGRKFRVDPTGIVAQIHPSGE